MPSGYNYSCALLVLCVITSCNEVQAAGTRSDKWWYIILVPLGVVFGIVLLLLVLCLRRRCNRQADAEFFKIVSSASSSSRWSQNSVFYRDTLNPERHRYDVTLKSRNEILATDSSCKKIELDGANGIQNFVKAVPSAGNPDETSSQGELSLTVSQDARCSPIGERPSLEIEKKSEIVGSTRTELTIHHLKTCDVDFESGGVHSPSDTLTMSVINNNCTKLQSPGINSTDQISRFKLRSISATTSDSDYYDLDDDEVEKSIQREEHWNSTNIGDSLFITDPEIQSSFPGIQNLRRPLPEISEPLEIVMDNELYTSL